jgi:hypothetical protein
VDHLLRLDHVRPARDGRIHGQLQAHRFSRWAKAMWTLLIVFLPFLGILIYLIAGPKEPQPV